MKWKLLPLLNEEFYRKIRHSYGRKMDRWQSDGVVSMTLDEIAMIGPAFVANSDATPFVELPEEFVDSIFVAAVGNELFLVNTEGHSYCRYIALIEVLPEEGE